MAYGAPPTYGPPPGPAPAPYGPPPQAYPPPAGLPPAPVSPPMQPAKPAGIMLVAILDILIGVFQFVDAAAMIFVGLIVIAAANIAASASGIGGLSGIGNAIGGVCIAFGVIFILFGIIFFVIAYGIMNMKSWARKWNMILLILVIIFSFFGIGGLAIGGSYAATGAVSLLLVIFSILALVYLMTPGIKAAFEPPRVMVAPMMMMGPPPPMAPPQQYPPAYPPQGYGPPPQAPPPGYGPPPY